MGWAMSAIYPQAPTLSPWVCPGWKYPAESPRFSLQEHALENLGNLNKSPTEGVRWQTDLSQEEMCLDLDNPVLSITELGTVLLEAVVTTEKKEPETVNQMQDLTVTGAENLEIIPLPLSLEMNSNVISVHSRCQNKMDHFFILGVMQILNVIPAVHPGPAGPPHHIHLDTDLTLSDFSSPQTGRSQTEKPLAGTIAATTL